MTDEAVSTPAFDPVPALVTELGLPAAGVAAVIALLDEGNTVPFIARYRKERTGGLDEVQIRAIEEQRDYLVELEERRAAILASIAEQGKLTPELEAKLRAATGKAELEDLYVPYRPRRKTRASVARERGSSRSRSEILAQGADGDPAAEAAAFVGEEVADADDALAGARDIVAERVADTAEVRAFVRREFAEHGELVSRGRAGQGRRADQVRAVLPVRGGGEGDPVAPLPRDPARRGRGRAARARRGRRRAASRPGIQRLAQARRRRRRGPRSSRSAVADALKRLLAPSVENDVRAELKQRADVAAVDVFAENLRNLLLAAPLGGSAVIGIDPGPAHRLQVRGVDETGKFLGTITVYIAQGDAQLAKAKDELRRVRAASTRRARSRSATAPAAARPRRSCKQTLAERRRRPSTFVRPGQRGRRERLLGVATSRARSSPSSTSRSAARSRSRGACRIRSPSSSRSSRSRSASASTSTTSTSRCSRKKLDDVVESCVNHVGVELNTASAQLLGYVAGIGESLAKKIVAHRDAHGAFAVARAAPRRRRARAQGVRAGGRASCASAARANPLDASAVHPERYALVERMAARPRRRAAASWSATQELVDKIDLAKYVAERRRRADAARHRRRARRSRAAIRAPSSSRRSSATTSPTMEDLKPGMVLEGVVTNVTAFGAFVDIGVHQDGLVHVSQLADQFVKDPSEVVKVGQKLTVRVLEVDLSASGSRCRRARRRPSASVRRRASKASSRARREAEAVAVVAAAEVRASRATIGGGRRGTIAAGRRATIGVGRRRVTIGAGRRRATIAGVRRRGRVTIAVVRRRGRVTIAVVRRRATTAVRRATIAVSRSRPASGEWPGSPTTRSRSSPASPRNRKARPGLLRCHGVDRRGFVVGLALAACSGKRAAHDAATVRRPDAAVARVVDAAAAPAAIDAAVARAEHTAWNAVDNRHAAHRLIEGELVIDGGRHRVRALHPVRAARAALAPRPERRRRARGGRRSARVARGAADRRAGRGDRRSPRASTARPGRRSRSRSTAARAGPRRRSSWSRAGRRSRSRWCAAGSCAGENELAIETAGRQDAASRSRGCGSARSIRPAISDPRTVASSTLPPTRSSSTRNAGARVVRDDPRRCARSSPRSRRRAGSRSRRARATTSFAGGLLASDVRRASISPRWPARSCGSC